MLHHVTVDRIEEGIAVMQNERDQTEIHVAVKDVLSFSIEEGDMLTVEMNDQGAIQVLDKRTEAQSLRKKRIKDKQKKLAGQKSGSRFKK